MTSTDYKHINGSGLSHLFGLLKGKYGEPQTPYTEVEWVESNGTQYVYLDWTPPIATWGFEADFIVKNAFSTTGGGWNQSTNVNGYGNVFGTRGGSMTNDVQLGTYGSTGILRWGTAGYTTSGLFKTDKTRQQVSLRGTSLRRGDGATVTITRSSETANKPYANMTVFAMHEGVRRSVTGNLAQPGTVRIYSLKFYDGNTLVVNLVGAIRNRDGMTGLYDKVKGHFYPAANMTYGAVVGSLGTPDTVTQAVAKKNVEVFIDNRAITRMWSATVPELDKLEDGQQITAVFTAAISGSTPTAAGLVGWDETSTTSYSNVYLKLTLADGSDTEWIPCYYSSGVRLTGHYGAGTPVLLTYRENVLYNATTTSAGTSMPRAWYADPNYNTDDLYTRYSDTVIAGLNGVKRYSLNMRDVNGNWTSIMNQDNNTGATGKTAYTGGLQLGNVLYHDSSANIAAGGNTGRMKESHGGVDFRYDVNGVTNAAGTTELTLRKPVYLVGTVGSDSLFYLDTTKWWTQDSFTTDKVYVLVGTAYSSYYAIFLSVNNPAFTYDGSKLVPFAAGNCSGTASNVTGIVAVANGGTGKTTAQDAANSLINALSTGSSTPGDADYYVSQYVSGGSTTTTYHRRPVSALWEYMKGKISSVLGLTSTEYGGNSATTTKLKTARTINVGNKATGTATSFDGSANITVPVNSLLTDALVEPSIVKSGTKTSLPLVDTLKGNKLALLPADQIIIEKTTDGGATWVDYGATDEQKRALFVGNATGSNITIPLLNGVKNVNCGVRITFTAMKYNVPEGTAETGKYAYWNSANVKSQERYCSLQAMYFWVSTNSDGLSCKCEKANGNNANTWTTVFNKDTTEAITGWSGGDYIAFNDQVFGGGTTQVGQAWNWRLTFFTRNNAGGTTLSTSNTGSAQQINRILGYGANGWGIPNQLFATGHLYNWNTSGDATFPASIFPSANNVGSLGASTLKWNSAYATTFYGNVDGGIRNSSSTRPTSANTTGYGAYLRYFLATSSMTTGKPTTGDGHILDMEWDNNGKWHGQLAVPTDATKHVQWRTEAGGTWMAWANLLDSRDLSSATDSSSETLVATPKAVKAAYDLANSASTTAGQAMSAATGALVFKVTYSVSGSTVTCAAHVYSAGAEVTSNHADSCFVWSMSLDGGTSWTSLGTGKTKAVTAMTAFGGNVKCAFTPAS